MRLASLVALMELAAMLTMRDAAALPAVGSKVVAVSVVGVDGRAWPMPLPKLPLLAVYEDKDSGKQNLKAQVVIGTFTDNAGNNDKFQMLAIADVEKYNWWPAKRYVLDDLRDVQKKTTVPLVIDWKGAARKGWGLTHGKSTILLVMPDGVVRFAAEGTLSDGQLRDLAARLVEVGAQPVK